MRTDKEFWLRSGAVAAGIWVALMVIVSAISDNFEWFPGSYSNPWRTVINFGPAVIVTLCGLAIIAAVSFGIPWIAEAKKDKDSDRSDRFSGE